MREKEIRKEIASPETEEVVKILESLDKNSIILAGTYITALADSQRIQKVNQAFKLAQNMEEARSPELM